MIEATYSKRDGTSGISGQLYELKLVMHFLITGLLARKRGDIDHFFLGTNVDTAGSFDDLVFKYMIRNKSKIVLLQAKHKSKPTAITLKKLLAVGSKRGDFNIKHYFESYRNSKLVFGNTDDPVLRDQFENCEFILLTNAKFESNPTAMMREEKLDDFWRLNDKKRSKLIDEENTLKDLLNASSVEISDFLNQFTLVFDQPNELELNDLIKEKIYSYLNIIKEDVEYIYDIVLENIKEYWANENKYLTEKDDFLLKSQNVWKARKEITLQIDYYKKLNINYESVNTLIGFIGEKSTLHIMTNETTKLLHELQINQALIETGLKYIFLDTTKFQDMHEIVLDSFINEYDALVVSGSKCVDLKKFDDRLIEILKHNRSKKVILIGECVETILHFDIVEGLDVSFASLSSASQKKILLETQIELQGKSATLDRVVLPNLTGAIDDELLAVVIRKIKPLTIGKTMPGLGDTKNSHISRKLKRGGVLYDPEDLLKSEEGNNEKFVLIAGHPGMGKSTLLSSLTEECCRNSDFIWHYRINLTEHTERFAEMKNADSLQFLRRSCEMDNFEFMLFEEYFRTEGKILLFFDGFDEISPQYKDVVLELFRDLINTRVEKILVTTRFCLKDELERKLQTTAYHLEPFSREDQKEYLKLLGKENDGTIEKLLTMLIKSTSIEQLNGIPLQLKMLVEIYDESNFDHEINIFRIYDRFVHKKYYDVVCKEKAKIDISNLYVKKLIEKDYADMRVKYENIAIFQLYEPHLFHLLSDKEIKEIKKGLDEDVNDGKEQTGIITSGLGGKPVFLHRTFAEFFAATRLVRALEDGKKIDTFLRAIGFFGIDQTIMRDFFDFALADDEEIIRVTLNNDFMKIINMKADFGKCDKGGRSALHLAAARDYVLAILFLISGGAEVSAVDQIFGWTPISYADKHQSLRSIEHLLDAKADSRHMYETIETLKKCVDGDYTLVHRASEWNLITFLKVALTINPSCVNFGYRDDCDKTPLHFASICGHLPVVKYLTDNYLSLINCADGSGRTPLIMAAENGYYEIAKALIDGGSTMSKDIWQVLLEKTIELGHASIEQLLNDYKSKIIDDYADMSSHAVNIANNEPEFVKLIEIHKAIVDNKLEKIMEILASDTNLIDRILSEQHEDQLPKMKMLLKCVIGAVRLKDVEILKYLVSQNERLLQLTDEDGATPLHLACAIGNLTSIEYLLGQGADPKAKDSNGHNCLYYSTVGGHLAIVKLMASSIGNRFDDVDKNGETLLHAAAYFNSNKDIVIYLIQNGVDQYKRNESGRNFVHVAIQEGHAEFVKLSISLNPELMHSSDEENKNSLHIAASVGNIEIVSFLFELGADPTASNDGLTPLHAAILNKHRHVVEYFLNKNPKWINATTPFGTTLLHAAAQAGALEIMVYLEKMGACPTVRDAIGLTCLHFAVVNDDYDVLKHLIETKPELANIGDAFGNTPLHYAAMNNKIQAAELLLRHGADLLTKNEYGETFLHQAVAEGYLEFAERIMPFYRTWTAETVELLATAADNGRIEVLKYLANLKCEDDNGLTLLRLVFDYGDFGVLLKLLEADGGRINGTTLLGVAAELDKMEILTFLLENGADPSIRDVCDKTCFDYASDEGKILIAKYL